MFCTVKLLYFDRGALSPRPTTPPGFNDRWPCKRALANAQALDQLDFISSRNALAFNGLVCA